MKKRTQTITLYMLIVLLGGCHAEVPFKNSLTNKTTSEKTLAAPQATSTGDVRVDKSLSARLPSLHKPQGMLQRTVYVGTPEHPTLDGGIINAADGMPVDRHFPIAEVTQQHTPVNTHGAVSMQSAIDTKSRRFGDAWATSDKVKSLLSQAARDGKLDYVLKKTGELGLPASVATVPIVESHYQSDAISPKGAAGAWQLMPAVAKDYGIDNQERFQFTTSTNTALSLLRDLHQQFGSWELAYAAYNAGAGRVQAALQKNPMALSVEQLDLPKETKDYVNRIKMINTHLLLLS